MVDNCWMLNGWYTAKDYRLVVSNNNQHSSLMNDEVAVELAGFLCLMWPSWTWEPLMTGHCKWREFKTQGVTCVNFIALNAAAKYGGVKLEADLPRCGVTLCSLKMSRNGPLRVGLDALGAGHISVASQAHRVHWLSSAAVLSATVSHCYVWPDALLRDKWQAVMRSCLLALYDSAKSIWEYWPHTESVLIWILAICKSSSSSAVHGLPWGTVVDHGPYACVDTWK